MAAEAQSTQLQSELSQRQREIDLLLETANLLNSDLDPASLLQKIAERSRELVNAQTVIIPVLNDACTEYCYRAGAGKYIDEIIGESLPIDFGICGWVWRNKRAWWHGTLNEMSADEQKRWATTAESMVLVPLIGKQHFLGGIAAEYKQNGEPFDDKDLHLLTLFASQAAIALENAMLYEQLQKLNDELEGRIEQRTEELQQSNKQLESFCYAVSHDLKAPLRSINGFSQALLEDHLKSLDPEAADYLNRICSAGLKMNSLIDVLLEFSRAHEQTLSTRKGNLSNLAQEICETFKQQSCSKNYQIDIQTDMHATYDPALMHSALNNLFSNAIKYSSKEKQPRIQFGLHSENKNEQIFFITDNGAGFDMNKKNLVFSPFKRLHKESEFPGTGIGLSTVEKIIHKHHGKIWFESEPGKGATFFFSLPTSKEPAA